MTDNNEATAWNGVMGGGNAASPTPDCSKPESMSFGLGTAFGSAIGTATTMAMYARARRLARRDEDSER